MKLILKKGTTSKILHIFIQDSSKSDGSGLTGLVYNSSGLTAYYIREGDSSATAISLTNTLVGIYISGGFTEVDATNMPGVYELHLPNACLAAGAEQVVIMLKGATNMAPLPLEIQLDDNTAKDVYDRIGAPIGASISVDVADVPTVAEFNARTLLAADYFDPTSDAVANVTLVATTTTNTDMIGTANAALAATALSNAMWTDAKAGYIDAAISGRAPANEYDTPMGYIPANLSDVPTAAELIAAHGSGAWTTADISALATAAALSTHDSKLDLVKAKTDTIDWSDITSLIDEIGGKWEITGDQMLFYKSDNVTEIMRFNLFDSDGNPAMANVYKRERVP